MFAVRIVVDNSAVRRPEAVGGAVSSGFGNHIALYRNKELGGGVYLEVGSRNLHCVEVVDSSLFFVGIFSQCGAGIFFVDFAVAHELNLNSRSRRIEAIADGVFGFALFYNYVVGISIASFELRHRFR